MPDFSGSLFQLPIRNHISATSLRLQSTDYTIMKSFDDGGGFEREKIDLNGTYVIITPRQTTDNTWRTNESI